MRMSCYRLEITENDFVTEDGKSLKLFGIRAFDDVGNVLEDCQSISDDRKQIEAFSAILIENDVSICHIKDIVEDMF